MNKLPFHVLCRACVVWAVIVAGTIGVPLAAAADDEAPVAVVKWDKPPAIDGDAAKWAAVQASASIPGKAGEAAWVKLGYDSDNFYALVQVKDDSPLKNGATVEQELLKGGDAVGFCFGPAGGKGANQRILVAQIGGKPVVLAMRPEWPDKSKPYTYRTSAAGAVKMDYVAPLAGGQASLKIVDGGYATEVKIPWRELGYAPAEGFEFPFDVQVIFSDKAGTTNVDTAWWHSTGTGPTATMDIATEARLYPEAWGKAKLYGRDPGAQKSRRALDEDEQVFYGPGAPITFELPREARVSLIVTNDSGWVVRELLRTRKLGKGQHTVYWDGRDRTGQPMPRGEYRYRIGYFDGIKASFYGSVGNSGRPVYRTPDGMGSIGGTHGGPSAIGADADGVYMLNSVEEGQKCLRKIDPVTGKAKWFASTGVFGTGFAVAADDRYAYMIFGPEEGARIQRFDARTGQPVKIGTQDGPIKLGKIGVQGLAIAGDKAYYSEQQKNRIGVIDLQSGQPGTDIAIQSPSGLCRLDQTTLLVCAGKQVLKLDTTSGHATPLIRDLTDARAVAVDKQGAIYVADLGASQQIKKYAANGTLQATFGKAGGRALTVPSYDALEFRSVAGLAVGPDDNLWMVEQASSPRRYAKLTRDGKWLEDFYGPSGYVTVAVDLDDFSSVYYQSTQSGPEYIRTRLDYAAYAKNPGSPVGTWRVEALYNMTQNGVDRSAKPDLFTETMTSGYGKALVFTATNGKRYFWKAANYSCLYVWEAGRWRAAAAVNNVSSKQENVSYWSDANGDGLVQDAESSREPIPTSGWTWIDRDLTLHGQDGSLAPARIDERGVPYYAGGKYTAVLKADQRPLSFYFDLVNYYVFGAPPASDGSRYYVANIGPDQGKGFWDRASETRLMKVKGGKPQWIIGHHDGSMRRDGDNQMLMNMAGEQDGVIIAAEVSGNFTAYTSDGLTLGWIATDEKGRMVDDGPTAWYVENVQPGLFLKDPKTGKHLLFGASTEDVRVLEINGVFGDDITCMDGKVTLPSPQPRANVAAGQYTIPYSTWTLHDVRFLGVSGYDWRWAKDIPALTISDGKSVAAEVRLRRDAGMLCVFADVLDGTPMPQVDAKTPADLFGKADGIELLLGPVLPDGRNAPVAGDTRIFLSATRNKDGTLTGTALAMRPASSPLPASPTLRALNNDDGAYEGNPPTGTIDFSKSLLPIPGAVVVVRERLDGLGYRLEAEIPLSLLPELTTTTPVNFKRNKNINTTEPRPDLTAPVRFNAALWLGDVSGTPAKRLAWVNDAQGPAGAMNPSAWGMANAQVEVQWPSISGAVSYSLYRATSPDPAQAVLVKKEIPDTRFTDLPGLGQFYYWLAAANEKGEGQWCGPVQAREGAAGFVSFVNRPASQLSAIPTQYAFPGTATVISVAVAAEELAAEAPGALNVKTVKRNDSLWTVVVTAAEALPAGKPLSVKLVATAAGKPAVVGRFTVAASPVPLNGYSVVADIMTDGTLGPLEIDPSQPADGAAGKATVKLAGSGKGLIGRMALGKHGFALLRWKGQAGSKRQICAPFVDTLENDGFYPNPLGYTPLKAKVGPEDGDIACAPVPYNGQSSVTIKTTDSDVHLLTLISGARFGTAPATRFSVTNPKTKVSWILAELPAAKGVTVIQFRFSGEITLTVQQVGPGRDQYDCSNVGAIFFD